MRTHLVAGALVPAVILLAGCAQERTPSAAAFGLDKTIYPTTKDTVAGADYWTGTVEDAPPTVTSAAQCAELFKPYLNPPMMAIGDSLYNGVSSLRINWWLSEWSTPSQVAIPLGLIHQTNYQRDLMAPKRFWGPQYPTRYPDDPADRHYTTDLPTSDPRTLDFGLDLEGVSLGRLINARTFTSMVANLDYLSDKWVPADGRLFNDNIAYFGSDTTDMLQGSAASFLKAMTLPTYDNDDTGRARQPIAQQLDEIRHQYRNDATTAGTALTNAFIAKNAAFVLNPMRHKCVEGLTSIDQVKLRHPHRLLINVGSNNGVWMFAFAPRPDVLTQRYRRYPWVPGKTITIEEHLGNKVYVQDMSDIIDTLSHVDGLEFVYINGMMLPSRAANLMPSTKEGDIIWKASKPQNSNGYFDWYRPVFSIGPRYVISGDELSHDDGIVRQANSKLVGKINEANARPGVHPKFVYVDLDSFARDFDYKHLGEDARRIAVAPGEGVGTSANPVLWLDNRALSFGKRIEVDGKRFTNLASGGFFSYDNMHLTTAGYGLVAMTVLDAIRENEPDAIPDERYYWQAIGLIHPASHMAQDAWRQDTILRTGTKRDDRERDTISLFLPTVAHQ